MSDLIDRQEAIEHCKKRLYESAYNNTMVVCDVSYIMQDIADNRIDVWLKELPSAQPEVKPIEYRDCANPPMVNITATWISGRMKNENGRLNQQTSCD